MKISLEKVGKRFNREWIFRHLNYEFLAGNTYAIVGPNGSGKSTLLQVIGGATTISEGLINSSINGKTLENHGLFKHVSIAAPYLEVIEEMTITEFLDFHASLKPLLPWITVKEIISRISLTKAAHKQIRYFSSGMKQRVKLAQAIFTDTPVILLDEPCTNLDTEGIDLYRKLISDFATGRMIIVSSNDIQEYDFCQHLLQVNDYKGF